MCTYTYSDSRNQDQDSRMHMGLMKINGTSFPEEEATGGMEDGEASSSTTPAMGINRSRSPSFRTCHLY